MTNHVSQFLAKHLIGLLWYISEYPNFEDFSSTARRDCFEDFIEDFYTELTPGKREEVLATIRAAAGGFINNQTYYGPRLERFLNHFIKTVELRGDPALLFADGRDARRESRIAGEKPKLTGQGQTTHSEGRRDKV